ncbi:MAG: transglutaminase family protein [Thermostichales cyanobacterium SZTDM-1c_bins_54]
MEYQILHQIRYDYSQPVRLEPHRLLLHPRQSPRQQVHSFTLHIQPQPSGQAWNWDLNGSQPLTCWFRDPLTALNIQMQATVGIDCPNPFAFLLESWAARLPIDYPHALYHHLSPDLQVSPDPLLGNLVWEWQQEVQGSTVGFVCLANQRVHEHCRYQERPSGDPWPAAITWARQQGSCRDLAVLLMTCYRLAGLAARFVSGYVWTERGSRHLHAWTEVYLPGAGWRGFDPTQGLAVAEHHIAVAAHGIPRFTAPVQGYFQPAEARSTLTTQVHVQPLAGPWPPQSAPGSDG